MYKGGSKAFYHKGQLTLGGNYYSSCNVSEFLVTVYYLSNSAGSLLSFSQFGVINKNTISQTTQVSST